MTTTLPPTRRTRPSLTVRIRYRDGTGRERKLVVGWSAREAGILASEEPIPSRTVEHWAATGLVGPTVRPGQVWPDHYATPAARVYGLGDVVAVRLTRDLLERGTDRDVVREVAAGVAGWGPDRWRDWRSIAARGDVAYVLPADMAGVEEIRAAGAEPGWLEREDDLVRQWDDLVHTGDGWREIGCSDGGPMLVYPVGDVVAGILRRVEWWRIGKGVPQAMLAQWL